MSGTIRIFNEAGELEREIDVKSDLEALKHLGVDLDQLRREGRLIELSWFSNYVDEGPGRGPEEGMTTTAPPSDSVESTD